MSPTKPLRPCPQPGCPALVERGRCPKHQLPPSRRVDARQRRFYGGAQWKALRALVKREEPTCRLCGTESTASVDHIDGDYRNNLRSNLRGLCTRCERSRTAKQHRAKVGESRPEPKEEPWPWMK